MVFSTPDYSKVHHDETSAEDALSVLAAAGEIESKSRQNTPFSKQKLVKSSAKPNPLSTHKVPQSRSRGGDSATQFTPGAAGSSSVKRQKTLQGGERQCGCKNTKCLKQYCECFKVLAHCTKACGCVNCENLPEFDETTRKIAINAVKDRNPDAFKPKSTYARVDGVSVLGNVKDAIIQVHPQGCKCRKNIKCLKRYCVCFDAGLVCSELCQCVSCSNYIGNPDRAKKLSVPEDELPTPAPDLAAMTPVRAISELRAKTQFPSASAGIGLTPSKVEAPSSPFFQHTMPTPASRSLRMTPRTLFSPSEFFSGTPKHAFETIYPSPLPETKTNNRLLKRAHMASPTRSALGSTPLRLTPQKSFATPYQSAINSRDHSVPLIPPETLKNDCNSILIVAREAEIQASSNAAAACSSKKDETDPTNDEARQEQVLCVMLNRCEEILRGYETRIRNTLSSDIK